MKFRYDIGLLRAIAVLSVLLYHYKVPGFGGGFSGVDVFFVISGFLMTKIILSGFEKGSFSVWSFIVKRAKRIVPPLVVLGFCLLLISSLLFFGNTHSQNSRNIFVGLTFISNIYFWLKQSYFDSDAQSNIFLHSWSLSVEWQFYMLYPILLYPFKKLYFHHKKWFTAGLLTFTALSFSLCLLLIGKYSTFTFYMIPTRAWEMTLGGLALLYSDHIKLKDTARRILIILSFGIILLCNVFLKESMPWPSAYTLFPAIATFLIIALNTNYSWYQNKLFQFVGKISYSLYLWHWPFYVIFRFFLLDKYPVLLIPIALSFICAILSYYLIEQKEGFGRMRFIIPTALVSLGCALVFFYKPANAFTNSVRVFNDNYKAYYDKYDQLDQFNAHSCFVTSDEQYTKYDYANCLKVDVAKQNILLLGDSHSAELSKSFRKSLSPDQHLLEVSAGMTFPFLEPKGLERSVTVLRHFYKEFLPAQKQHINKLFISVHWLMDLGYSKPEIKTHIQELIQYLEQNNINYYFIGQTEKYTAPFPKIALQLDKKVDQIPDMYYDQNGAEMNHFLMSFIPKERYINVYKLPGMRKIDQQSNMPYMFDNNHLTEYGADQLTAYLIRNKYL
ncbi:acyltransferase family protein [Edaphocola flava]|uniref:acyltransferase family protein n=1 Tax=Edaphocola flava TaxID=2499629 RepID=UPI00100B8603|nr:acyltransferase family protein [Edaphocola flava]